ncbi:hypothetical protein SETIT_7G235800v2 [Setaria italica]|nr:hypothetical protein SETIT_7G235800v2 [Setaria italica]
MTASGFVPDAAVFDSADVSRRPGRSPPQAAAAYAGNPDLSGPPLKQACSIPSSLSNLPNATDSPPAFVAIPKNHARAPPGADGQQQAPRDQAPSSLGTSPLAQAEDDACDMAMQESCKVSERRRPACRRRQARAATTAAGRTSGDGRMNRPGAYSSTQI